MNKLAAKEMFLPLETCTCVWVLGGKDFILPDTALHLLYSKKEQNSLEWFENFKHLCKNWIDIASAKVYGNIVITFQNKTRINPLAELLLNH